MKKIPTLFKRTFDERHRKHITSDVTPGLEWVLEGRGIATVKYDGTCCALMDGKFYRRYIVFWLDGEPMCKIKRSDYGFKWPETEGGATAEERI